MKNKFNKIVSVSLAAMLTVGVISLPTTLANANETVNVKATVDARGVVTIPDENLRNEFKRILGTVNDSDITVSALNGLTGTIDLSNKNITNLLGVENLINITNLNISDNNIQNVPEFPLNSKLQTFNGTRTNVTDLNFLKNCFELVTVGFFGCDLENIDALSGKINLRVINLNNQKNKKLKSLNALNNLPKLQRLWASDSGVEDIRNVDLSSNSLDSVMLQNNNISDISPFKNLSANVRANISLSNNLIYDMSPLKLHYTLSSSGRLNVDFNNVNIANVESREITLTEIDGEKIKRSPDGSVKIKNPVKSRNVQNGDSLVNYGSDIETIWGTIPFEEQANDIGAVHYLLNDNGVPLAPTKAANSFPRSCKDFVAQIFDSDGVTPYADAKYLPDTNEIVWNNVPKDTTELYFAWETNMLGPSHGVHSTPYKGKIKIVIEQAIDYTVIVNPTTNGTASVDKNTAKAGETVTITTTPNAGYELDTITATDASGANVPVTGNSFTMPAEDVTVAVTFKAIDYTVTVNTDANGTANVDKDVANIGDVVNVTTTPNAGYEVDTITVNGTVITGNSFTMPAEDVVVEVTFKAIDYTVTVNPTTNGTANVDKDVANVGDIITLTINANEGYQLKEGTLKVITASGIEIPLTQMARMTNGTFTFEMPAEDVTVFAEFELIPVITPPVEPEVPEPPVVEPEKPQPPIVETKPETGKNPTTGTTGLAGILGAMGLAGTTTLFTRKRKNK